MSRTRAFSPFLLALALFAGAGAARADQLQAISKADAEKAAACLTPGTIVVEWITTLADRRPVLYYVLSAEAKPCQGLDGYFEVSAKVVKVGQAKTARQPTGAPYAFELAKEADAKETTLALDLAYTYVPSSELAGVFVNLGKKLCLDCQIKTPAIEVGTATVAEIEHRMEEAAAATIGGSCEEPSGGIVDRIPGE